MWTVDEVIARLNERRQRATYGAVAEVVKAGAPQGLMKGRMASYEDSWVVAKKTDRKSGSRRGRPTGYPDSQIHPECLRQIRDRRADSIETATALRQWLGGGPP